MTDVKIEIYPVLLPNQLISGLRCFTVKSVLLIYSLFVWRKIEAKSVPCGEKMTNMMYDLRVIIIQDKTFTFPSQLSRRSVKQVELSWNPLWIVSHPHPRCICTHLIPCLLDTKSTDNRYIILLPVLPLHKSDTDTLQYAFT